jgi:hypothetical protein
MTKNEFDLVIMALKEADMIPHRDSEKMAKIVLNIFGRRELGKLLGLLETSKDSILTFAAHVIANEY